MNNVMLKENSLKISKNIANIKEKERTFPSIQYCSTVSTEEIFVFVSWLVLLAVHNSRTNCT